MQARWFGFITFVGLSAATSACSSASSSDGTGNAQQVTGADQPSDVPGSTLTTSADLGEPYPPGDLTPHPSAGCGGNPSPPIGGETLESGGAMGHYIITTPPNYDATQPYSLAFVFHGSGESDVSCRGGGNCAGVPDALEGHSIVVYMKSFGTDWTNDTREQNVTWFDDLLANTKANYCVDERRVYAVGTSSGAHFTNLLGCRRGDKLLAIVPAAGERLETTGCVGRVAALVIHGVVDSHVPIADGERARDDYAQLNGCTTTTVPELASVDADLQTAFANGVSSIECADYQGCIAGLPVRWCEHSDPGYDGTTHGFPVEGGTLAWDFVSQL
jgi:poly(3-hydroxybutyrate) depolymerase